MSQSHNQKYRTCLDAAKANDLPALKEMFYSDYPIKNYSFDSCLQQIQQPRQPLFDDEVFYETITWFPARNDNLEMLTFLHINGAVWSNMTITYASETNCLRCMEYAISNGCPFDWNNLADAARYSSVDCFQFLLSMCKEKGMLSNEVNNVVINNIFIGYSQPFRNCERAKKKLELFKLFTSEL